MATLLDPPEPDALRLLTVIAEGWQANREKWPIWQYVMLRMDQEGYNAGDILRSLPTWNYNYRSLFSPTSGQAPQPEEQVALTMHGMIHAGHPATRTLVDLVLYVLQNAETMQRTAIPNPETLIDMTHTIDELMQMRVPPTRPEASLVGDVLKHEPWIWSGVTCNPGTAVQWDLSQPRLGSFKGVRTGEQYLAGLEEIIGVGHPQLDETRILDPMSLPEALDHLNLAWLLATKKKIHLVSVPRASIAARLTQPVNSEAEFQTACSALADILNHFQPNENDQPPGTLVRLRLALRELLKAEDPLIEAAVSKLQNVAGIRNGQQHSGSEKKVDRDSIALGLPRFGSDWTGRWHRVSVETLTALTTIREALSNLI